MAIAVTRRKNTFFSFFGLFRARNQHGEEIRELLDRLEALPRTHPEVIGFQITLDRVRRAEGLPRSSCRDLFCGSCVSDMLDGFNGESRAFLAAYRANVREVRNAVDYIMTTDQRVRPDISQIRRAA